MDVGGIATGKKEKDGGCGSGKPNFIIHVSLDDRVRFILAMGEKIQHTRCPGNIATTAPSKSLD